MLSPRWTATRTARRLDGIWDFAFDPADAGIDQQWWSGQLPEARPMPVPASFNDLVSAAEEREYVGVVWYQSVAQVQPAADGRRTVLRFDAATHRAQVWLDQHYLGEHVGGYSPFELDVTHLVAGRSELRITVLVDNRLTMHTIPPGVVDELADGRRQQRYFHDFFNYAGLARSVWLLTTPGNHVADLRVTTDLDAGRGLVRYIVDTAGDPGRSGEVAVTLRDSQGETVGQASGHTGELVVEAAHPWSPDSPYLYDLEVTYESQGVSDVYTQRVGIRTIAVDGTRLLLNGEPIHLRGFGMHEDAPWRGKGHDDARMVRDFTLLRWIGANSFRTSHYPYAEEVLDLADRLGFLVIDESPAVGLNLQLNADRVAIEDPRTFRPGGIDDETLEAHLTSLREMIGRDKNHPSVILWSVANEPDTTEEDSRPYFTALADLVRELDPSRPVGYANVAFATPDLDRVSDLFDVIMLNRYFGWYVGAGDVTRAQHELRQELTEWTQRLDKPIIIAEFGADALAGLHTLPAQMWSEEFQQELIAAYLDMFDLFDNVVGEHVWNFADFATMQGTNRVVGNRKGVFTRDREPKAVAFLLRERWSAKQT